MKDKRYIEILSTILEDLKDKDEYKYNLVRKKLSEAVEALEEGRNDSRKH